MAQQANLVKRKKIISPIWGVRCKMYIKHCIGRLLDLNINIFYPAYIILRDVSLDILPMDACKFKLEHKRRKKKKGDVSKAIVSNYHYVGDPIVDRSPYIIHDHGSSTRLGLSVEMNNKSSLNWPRQHEHVNSMSLTNRAAIDNQGDDARSLYAFELASRALGNLSHNHTDADTEDDDDNDYYTGISEVVIDDFESQPNRSAQPKKKIKKQYSILNQRDSRSVRAWGLIQFLHALVTHPMTLYKAVVLRHKVSVLLWTTILSLVLFGTHLFVKVGIFFFVGDNDEYINKLTYKYYYPPIFGKLGRDTIFCNRIIVTVALLCTVARLLSLYLYVKEALINKDSYVEPVVSSRLLSTLYFYNFRILLLPELLLKLTLVSLRLYSFPTKVVLNPKLSDYSKLALIDKIGYYNCFDNESAISRFVVNKPDQHKQAEIHCLKPNARGNMYMLNVLIVAIIINTVLPYQYFMLKYAIIVSETEASTEPSAYIVGLIRVVETCLMIFFLQMYSCTVLGIPLCYSSIASQMQIAIMHIALEVDLNGLRCRQVSEMYLTSLDNFTSKIHNNSANDSQRKLSFINKQEASLYNVSSSLNEHQFQLFVYYNLHPSEATYKQLFPPNFLARYMSIKYQASRRLEVIISLLETIKLELRDIEIWLNSKFSFSAVVSSILLVMCTAKRSIPSDKSSFAVWLLATYLVFINIFALIIMAHVERLVSLC